MELFLKLLFGHALADFSLQHDYFAKAKSRKWHLENLSVSQKLVPCWYYFMSAHALVHGCVVYLITGRILLSIVEIAAHWLIDFFKCENRINAHQDQALHILCKIFYLFL